MSLLSGKEQHLSTCRSRQGPLGQTGSVRPGTGAGSLHRCRRCIVLHLSGQPHVPRSLVCVSVGDAHTLPLSSSIDCVWKDTACVCVEEIFLCERLRRLILGFTDWTFHQGVWPGPQSCSNAGVTAHILAYVDGGPTFGHGILLWPRWCAWQSIGSLHIS